MNTPKTVVVCAAVIENNKLLLVKKRDAWILPGGKPKDHESDLECLAREVKDELSGTRLKGYVWYNPFEGISPHEKKPTLARVWFASIAGILNKPSSEITDAEYISDFQNYPLSDITQQIVSRLKQDRYL